MKNYRTKGIQVLTPGHNLPDSGISAHKFSNVPLPHSHDSHIHDIVEMTFLVKGEMVNIINDIPIHQEPGELFLISMGSRHQLKFKNVTYFNLYLDLDRFPMEMIPPKLADLLLPLLVPSTRFLHYFNLIHKITFENPKEVEYCFEQMVKSREENRLGWEASLLHWGNLILIECARSLHRLHRSIEEGHGYSHFNYSYDTITVENNTVLGRTNPILSVCHYLDLNFREPLSLEKLSRVCGYEAHYMCRKFKSLTGVTLSTYLHLRRIRQAMYLLTVSKERITQIALKCGYDDISYFNRQFRKHTGYRPGEYRKRNPSLL